MATRRMLADLAAAFSAAGPRGVRYLKDGVDAAKQVTAGEPFVGLRELLAFMASPAVAAIKQRNGMEPA